MIALCPHSLCWPRPWGRPVPNGQPLADLIGRQPLRKPLDLGKQIVRERHPGQRGPRLELPVQVLRDIADLNHGGHADSILSCSAHDKRKGVTFSLSLMGEGRVRVI